MASNAFGRVFRITTWGESHGKAIGVVIDGCPAGIEIDESDINRQLALRAPGKRTHTSARREPDHAEILSGVFEGKTTGTPISILIPNVDSDSSAYEPIKNLLRPGHANFTYLKKYGVFDYRGGGRASARETACRVAAGAVAKKFLCQYGIVPLAYIKEIAGVQAHIDFEQLKTAPQLIQESPLFCPDVEATHRMVKKIEAAHQDSVGGIVELFVEGLPAGLGDPVYQKFEAVLAAAMMSIPASKGFEIGSGFEAARMRGTEHNDTYICEGEEVLVKTNHAGGTLGGITTGMPLIVRVAFKPTSSIQKPQETVDVEGHPAILKLPAGSRHDPCVAIRAVPVVEAMAALVIADAILCNWSVRID